MDITLYTEKAAELFNLQEKISFLRAKSKKLNEELRKICGWKTRDENGYKFTKINRKGTVS